VIIHAGMNKNLPEAVSTTDYVLFGALLSLALALAVSLFINIVICFKLRRQKLDLAQIQTSSLATV